MKRLVQRPVSRDREIDGLAVSFVVIVYDMPEQAANTLKSLLPGYQLGVTPEDYEVLIIENDSGNNLPREFLDGLPENFRYYLRSEDQPTPVHAINHGIELAGGENICVMIDGARLLTPGVVRNTILGHGISSRAVVTVPGYHLGKDLQQKTVGSGYGVEEERALMRSIHWPVDGYRLFDIACFSGSCADGFYLPHGESNCISMPRSIWQELGGYDTKFDMRGGGLVNLDMYKRACEYPGVTHVFLHGEGTFHQFHGGVTTGGEEAAVRQKFIESILEQYRQIRGHHFEKPVTNTLYLGELSDNVNRFVHLSAARKQERMNNARATESVPA